MLIYACLNMAWTRMTSTDKRTWLRKAHEALALHKKLQPTQECWKQEKWSCSRKEHTNCLVLKAHMQITLQRRRRHIYLYMYLVTYIYIHKHVFDNNYWSKRPWIWKRAYGRVWIEERKWENNGVILISKYKQNTFKISQILFS